MSNRTPKSVAEEIKQHEIIKASSVVGRFKYIFEPLLEIARARYEKLESTIDDLNTGYKIDIKDHYTYKQGTGGDNIYDKFMRLTDTFNKLEESWKEIDSDWDTQSHCPLSDDHPLHVEKPDVYKATGKVRRYDYIGAYHFKAFLDALYGIAAEIRNISYNVYVNNRKDKDMSFGKTSKKESYSDTQYITSTSPEYITDISIFPNVDIDKQATFSFNDFIINSDSNGNQIFTYDELSRRDISTEISTRYIHGYVDDDYSLIPDSISADVVGNPYYINTNYISELSSNFQKPLISYFGQQATNQLQKYIPNDPSQTSASLDMFYNSPSRFKSQGADEFDYVADPSAGVASEFLSLKPAYKYNSNKQNPKDWLENWQEVSSKISPYFDPTKSGNRIVSKTYYDARPHLGKRGQKIQASTVNDLFKELNKTAARISAVLCGEYNIRIENGPIDEDLSPCGGLGYPEFFSWYWGSTSSSDYLTNGTLYTSNYTPGNVNEWEGSLGKYYDVGSDELLRFRQGNFSNGNQLATEDYDRNKVIRAGMFYYDSSSIDRISLENYKTKIKDSYSSLVPMTCNKFGVSGNTGYTKTSSETNFKSKMVVNSHNALPVNYTVEIQNQQYTNNAVRQIMNRYCVSHPVNIEEYKIDENHRSGTLSDAIYNVNAKYIFMPYMTWLSELVKGSQTIFNGIIPSPTDFTTPVNTYITSPSHYINNAGGIPVLYEDREDLWNETMINATIPADNDYICIGQNNKIGTIQLQLYDDYENLPLETNEAIDWFRYQLRAAVTVNEVNHTHRGCAWTKFYINDITKSIETNYGWHSAATSVTSWPMTNLPSNITSNLYVGLNSYANNPAASGIPSAYLNDATGDMMKMLYGKRFKFHDFYEDYNPLAEKSLDRSDIADYFTPGGSNKFVQGNATQVITWVTDISNSMNPPVFKILQSYDQESGSSSSGSEIYCPNLIQGNFFFSGNQSNVLHTNGKEYFYGVIPQPDPITATRINIIPSGTNKGHFSMRGSCYHFWNDVAEIQINLKKGTTVKEYKLKNIQRFKSGGIIRPFMKTYVPEISSGLISSTTTSGSVLARIEFNSNKYNISVELPTSNDLSPDGTTPISCTMRFINENGGYRDVCGGKSNATLEEGYFAIEQSTTYAPVDLGTKSEEPEENYGRRNWSICKYSSNWFSDKDDPDLDKYAPIRVMNILSPRLTEKQFEDRVQLAIAQGVDHFNVLICNRNDYVPSYSVEGHYCIYGGSVPDTNDPIWNSSQDDRIHNTWSNVMLNRIKYLRERGYGVILWLMADDDGTHIEKVNNIRTITEYGWNRHLLDHWQTYCTDISSLGFFKYATAVGLGLEMNEYTLSYTEITDPVKELKDILPDEISNYVGTHIAGLDPGGDADSYIGAQNRGKYFSNSGIAFLQTEPSCTFQDIKNLITATRNTYNNIDIYAFEMQRFPDRGKCTVALDLMDDTATTPSAYVHAVGNW